MLSPNKFCNSVNTWEKFGLNNQIDGLTIQVAQLLAHIGPVNYKDSQEKNNREKGGNRRLL
ncbi:hypothetical protein BH20BAC1_BH20BAC1_14300 [soil metagenome]